MGVDDNVVVDGVSWWWCDVFADAGENDLGRIILIQLQTRNKSASVTSKPDSIHATKTSIAQDSTIKRHEHPSVSIRKQNNQKGSHKDT